MSRTTETADNELVLQIAAGDERAFSILYRRHHAAVFRVACRYAGERHLAEDLAQEAFIRIHARILEGRYTETGKFVSWALRVALNLCLDHLRRPNPVRCVDSFEGGILASETTASPEEQLIARQRNARIRVLVAQLPNELRQVVYYRHYEELSFREIADRMGTGINTSLGRMRYGLQHLRNAYFAATGY